MRAPGSQVVTRPSCDLADRPRRSRDHLSRRLTRRRSGYLNISTSQKLVFRLECLTIAEQARSLQGIMSALLIVLLVLRMRSIHRSPRFARRTRLESDMRCCSANSCCRSMFLDPGCWPLPRGRFRLGQPVFSSHEARRFPETSHFKWLMSVSGIRLPSASPDRSSRSSIEREPINHVSKSIGREHY